MYSGLNIKCVKAFLAHSKIKGGGKMFSNSNLRKYKDAILWGSSEEKQPLPSSFYNDSDKFLKYFKKETSDQYPRNKTMLLGSYITIRPRFSFSDFPIQVS